MPWRQSQYAATSPCCSHCFLLIAFLFLGCASPSKFPASLLLLHRSIIFSVSIKEHIIWITEQCKLFIIVFLIYHIIVKPRLIQNQPDFQALNLLMFPVSGAKIHSHLRALQGTDIFADSRFISGFLPTRRHAENTFCNVCADLIQWEVLLLESWAAQRLLARC